MNLTISELIPSKANGGGPTRKWIPGKTEVLLSSRKQQNVSTGIDAQKWGGWCKRQVSVRTPPPITDAPPLHDTPFALPVRKVA